MPTPIITPELLGDGVTRDPFTVILPVGKPPTLVAEPLPDPFETLVGASGTFNSAVTI